MSYLQGVQRIKFFHRLFYALLIYEGFQQDILMTDVRFFYRIPTKTYN